MLRHSMESREPVEGYLVYGLEGLLAILKTLFTRYPDKKKDILGNSNEGRNSFFDNVLVPRLKKGYILFCVLLESLVDQDKNSSNINMALEPAMDKVTRKIATLR
jgi:hypothetical protein